MCAAIAAAAGGPLAAVPSPATRRAPAAATAAQIENLCENLKKNHVRDFFFESTCP